ncbi:MAG: peptidoglycan-binding protein, partial [bacterium]
MARSLLRRGDTGPAVADVRERLVRLGLLAPVPDTGTDAEFDDDVAQAVRAFQQSRGIPVDGVVGPQTFRHLEEARWSLGDRVLAYTPGHLIAGDDVLDLQRRLTRMG